MNLSHPLRSLLPAGAADCLVVLERHERGLSGRAVSRAVGSTSPASTRHALLSLVDTGLVLRETSDGPLRYRLNRRHLLWPALQSALDAPRRLEASLRRWVDESALPDTAVLLYGSAVRGEAGSDSDVDLLVVFVRDPPLAERDEFCAGLTRMVEEATGNRVEVYDLTERDLADHASAAEPVLDSWRQEARLIVGVRPALLERAA